MSDMTMQVISSRGYSAYEIAVQHGYTGTEEEWVSSLAAEDMKVCGQSANASRNIELNATHIPVGGESSTTVGDKLTELSGRVKDWTVSLSAADWSGSAPYTQDVSVTGVLESDNPIVDIDLSSATSSNVDSLLENWGKVHYISTSNGSISAVCLASKPTVNMTVRLKVIR